MATRTAAEILTMIAPEFKKVEEDVVSFWFELVKPLVNERRFKGQYNYAVALLAAHKMKLSGLGDGMAGTSIAVGSTQGIASVSEGGTSISFVGTSAGADSMDDEYSKTTYGLQYLNLRKQFVMCATMGD